MKIVEEHDGARSTSVSTDARPTSVSDAINDADGLVQFGRHVQQAIFRPENWAVRPHPMAEVEISAKVVTDRGGRVLAAKVFRASVPAASTEGPDAVSALDEAFQRVITDLVAWASHVV